MTYRRAGRLKSCGNSSMAGLPQNPADGVTRRITPLSLLHLDPSSITVIVRNLNITNGGCESVTALTNRAGPTESSLIALRSKA